MTTTEPMFPASYEDPAVFKWDPEKMRQVFDILGFDSRGINGLVSFSMDSGARKIVIERLRGNGVGTVRHEIPFW